MGSDPQSGLQAQYEAEHKACNEHIAELERELAEKQFCIKTLDRENRKLSEQLNEVTLQLISARESRDVMLAAEIGVRNADRRPI